MEYSEIERVVLNILESAEGRFLLPYQIYKEMQGVDSALTDRLDRAYPVTPGNPKMGRNAGIHYSRASFIAHALEYYVQHGATIRKEWINPKHLFIADTEAGNDTELSIWAWRLD